MSRIKGKYLKRMREERGYSLWAFAELIYTSKSSLQRWEKTYLPDNDAVVARIAEVLGMSREAFVRAASAPRMPDDGMTPDERAEAKFGLKGLKNVALIACFSVLGVMLVMTVLMIFFLVTA